jgi:hypothetical protein
VNGGIIFDYIEGNVTIAHDSTGRPMYGRTLTPTAICPDRLDHTKIGEADNLRGRVVRAFFFLMRLWPVKP